MRRKGHTLQAVNVNRLDQPKCYEQELIELCQIPPVPLDVIPVTMMLFIVLLLLVQHGTLIDNGEAIPAIAPILLSAPFLDHVLPPSSVEYRAGGASDAMYPTPESTHLMSLR